MILSLRRVLAQSGVFRDVRMWSLETQDLTVSSNNQFSPEAKLCIRAGFGPAASLQPPCRPQELLDPNGRRLILVISDCIDQRWDTQQVRDILQVWAISGSMALLQVLPEWLWNRTALDEVVKGQVFSQMPGQANQFLTFMPRERWRRRTPAGIKVPVVTLEPTVTKQWSEMVAGQSETAAPALLFSAASSQGLLGRSPDSPSSAITLTPQQRLEQFRNFSSPMARRLAGLLAACPEVNLPIVRLVQAAMLSDCQQVHVAEVLLGGLFKPQAEITAHTPADQVQYVFHDNLRPLVQDTISPDRAFAALSTWLNHRFGYSLEDFRAYVTPERIEQVKPFAGIVLDVLKRRGHEYADIINRIEQTYQSQTSPVTELVQREIETQEPTFPNLEILEFITGQLVETESTIAFPPLQMQEVEVVTLVFEEAPAQEVVDELQSFEFEMATIEQESNQPQEWKIHRQFGHAEKWVEILSGGIQLEMVMIPAGSFLMGSPLQELKRLDREGPQHEVTVEAFLMARYPITQDQWRFVAGLPKVNQELNPDPSTFKGRHFPVTQVSWYDAVEFCERLQVYTRREYRLPSEAEWEYACRAGTETPFHFGETISPDLANYRSTRAYKGQFRGNYRYKTTAVDYFNVANAFGLYEMHGNVWEWCLDHWHESYEEAPPNGSPWLSENQNKDRVARGGAWHSYPETCRSASRNFFSPTSGDGTVGFRVVYGTWRINRYGVKSQD